MDICKEINHPHYGEIVFDEDEKVVCHICGKSYSSLLSHVRQKHDLSGDEYREIFGLDKRIGLIGKKTKRKLQEMVKNNYDIIVGNNLFKQGSKTRFKNGNDGRTKSQVSEQTRRKLINNLTK